MTTNKQQFSRNLSQEKIEASLLNPFVCFHVMEYIAQCHRNVILGDKEYMSRLKFISLSHHYVNLFFQTHIREILAYIIPHEIVFS